MNPNRKIGLRTQKIFEQLADCIIPSGGMDYPGARDIGLVNIIFDWISGIRLGITAFKFWLWFWELSPLFFFHFKLFTQLTQEQKVKYLESWENSRLAIRRWMLFGLKSIFLASFYSQAEIQEKIGYSPGQCYRANAP